MAGANRKTPSDPKHRPERKGAWMVVTALVLVELMAYTWIRVAHIDTAARILKAREFRKQERAYQSELLVEKEHLRSPERIMRIAGQELDLRVPAPYQIIHLNELRNPEH